MVMAERGHFVSPQQCGDKFHDLNKKHKRLNEIIGRGTDCNVVESPTLLDSMDRVSEKAKEEVKKILGSKNLHYKEMHLPPDLALQRSLHLSLLTTPNEGNARRHINDNDAAAQDAQLDDHYEHEDHMAYGEGNQLAHDGISINQSTILLEEQRLHIQLQMLELERQRFNQQLYNKKKDRKLR